MSDAVRLSGKSETILAAVLAVNVDHWHADLCVVFAAGEAVDAAKPSHSRVDETSFAAPTFRSLKAKPPTP